MKTRVCTKCKKELTFNKFGMLKAGKYGIQPRCIECRKEDAEKYKEENLEKLKESKKRYVENNLEKVKKSKAKYVENNLEKRKESKKKYAHKNQESHNISTQIYRTRKLNLEATLTYEQWNEIKLHFESKCCYCRKDLPLTQDHFIAVSKNGEFTKNNIIPACLSCNSSKCNRDFTEWYSKYRHYSKKREEKY